MTSARPQPVECKRTGTMQHVCDTESYLPAHEDVVGTLDVINKVTLIEHFLILGEGRELSLQQWTGT